VSRLGGATAFAAEAALWISGAALIASAAGMHWSVPDVAGLTGASPSASVSASPSPSLAVQSLAPGASPTISPIVQKYQAYVARPDYQFKAKYVVTETAALNGLPYELYFSGTMFYRGGDYTESVRVAVNGTVTTYDHVYLGGSSYESKNGGAWTRSNRSANDIAATKLQFAPPMLFVDKGVEAKNGAQLHRLEVADSAAFSKAVVKTSSSGTTDAQMTYTVWVGDDGVPAAIRVEGWETGPINKVPTKMTATMEFRLIPYVVPAISAPV
jgi:hypothetical protein